MYKNVKFLAEGGEAVVFTADKDSDKVVIRAIFLTTFQDDDDNSVLNSRFPLASSVIRELAMSRILPRNQFSVLTRQIDPMTDFKKAEREHIITLLKESEVWDEELALEQEEDEDDDDSFRSALDFSSTATKKKPDNFLSNWVFLEYPRATADLDEVQKPLPTAVDAGGRLLCNLNLLRENKLSHGDLMAGNVLVFDKTKQESDAQLKLADFSFMDGLNASLPDPQLVQKITAPPELAVARERKEKRKEQTTTTTRPHADDWATGVLLLQTLAGKSAIPSSQSKYKDNALYNLAAYPLKGQDKYSNKKTCDTAMEELLATHIKPEATRTGVASSLCQLLRNDPTERALSTALDLWPSAKKNSCATTLAYARPASQLDAQKEAILQKWLASEPSKQKLKGVTKLEQKTFLILAWLLADPSNDDQLKHLAEHLNDLNVTATEIRAQFNVAADQWLATMLPPPAPLVRRRSSVKQGTATNTGSRVSNLLSTMNRSVR